MIFIVVVIVLIVDTIVNQVVVTTSLTTTGAPTTGAPTTGAPTTTTSIPTTSTPSTSPTLSVPTTSPAIPAEPVFAGYQFVCGTIDDGAVSYNSETGWNAIVESCNYHVKQNQDESWNKAYPFVHHPTDVNTYQNLFVNYFNPNPTSTDFYNHDGDIVATSLFDFFTTNSNPDPGIFRTTGNTFDLSADSWVGPGPVESIDAPSGPVDACKNWEFPNTIITTGMNADGTAGTDANGFEDSTSNLQFCKHSVWDVDRVGTSFPFDYDEYCHRTHAYMCIVEVFSYNGQVKLHSRRP